MEGYNMRTYAIEINTEFNQMFFTSQIEYTSKQIEEAKARLQRDIEKLDKLHYMAYSRYQEILQLDYYNEVQIHRHKDYYNKIIYEVTVYKVPQISQEQQNNIRYYNLREQVYFKKYTGQERREALKDAEDQAKQYRVELKKLGFN